jgi:beta-phosphoglucomutase-like phosphatase (HAD superfamily)
MAIIFDFDGVIVKNSLSILIKAASEIIKKRFPQINEKELLLDISNAASSFEKILTVVEAKYQINLGQSFINQMVDVYATSSLYKEMSEGLLTVLQHEKDVAIATNAQTKHVIMDIERLQLTSYFNAYNIFSARDCEFLKPNPQVFKYTAQMMNFPINDTWVIEDSSENLAGAKSLGFKTFGYIGADHFFDQEIATSQMQAAGADLISDDITAVLRHQVQN